MYNFKSKVLNINQLNTYMLTRTLAMFDWSGLPDTIPEIELEKQLQKFGQSFITEVDGELYALQGSLSGEVDVYGNHTEIIINNPSIKFNKKLDLSDGVLISNDSYNLGLIPIYERYNTLIVENEISMLLNSYNNRIQTLISAGDDKTKQSAEIYLKKVVEGEIGIIGESQLFEGVKTHAGNSNNSGSTQLIELAQYLKATLYNEVGLNANFNMKRERLNSSEVEMNTDQLRPLIDNMLRMRIVACEQLNEKYGLDVSVDFGSIWKQSVYDKETVTETIEDVTDETETETILETETETESETIDETESESDNEINIEINIEGDNSEIVVDSPNQLEFDLKENESEVIKDDESLISD